MSTTLMNASSGFLFIALPKSFNLKVKAITGVNFQIHPSLLSKIQYTKRGVVHKNLVQAP